MGRPAGAPLSGQSAGAAVLLAARLRGLLLACVTVESVLRFPDEYYDVRWPLKWKDCVGGESASAENEKSSCLRQLKGNMLDDLDCSAITPDNSHYITYDADKWSLDLCNNFVDLWKKVFDLALAAEEREVGDGKENEKSAAEAGGGALFLDSDTWGEFVDTANKRTRIFHEWVDAEFGVRSDGGDAPPPPPIPTTEEESTGTDSTNAYAEEEVAEEDGVGADKPVPAEGAGVAKNSARRRHGEYYDDGTDASVPGAEITTSPETAVAATFPKTEGYMILAHPADGNGRYVKLDRPPRFCNTTTAVVHRHFEALVQEVEGIVARSSSSSTSNFHLAALVEQIHRRTSLLIENWSMSVLVNFHLWRLEVNENDFEQAMLRDLIAGTHEKLAPGSPFVFVDVGPKRWNVLTYLLDLLLGFRTAPGSESRAEADPLRMVEVGVDTANSTERLLEIYDETQLGLHVGVDPYMNDPKVAPANNGDEMHEHVLAKLRRFGDRSVLVREKSLQAAKLFPDTIAGPAGAEGNAQEQQGRNGFDLIFLDARHDYRAVAEDVTSWIRKLKPEGPVILCGHDFQFQYPGLPMAVVAIGKRLQKPVYLASDGMWWIQFGF
eukprot:g7644.t1